MWALLRNLAKGEARALTFSKPLLELFDQANYDQLNKWIDEIAKGKHDLKSTIDFISLLGLLGNVVGKIFADWAFGVFESVTPKRFTAGRFQGNFRNLRGASQTFIHLLEYEGTQAFASSEVFVANPKTGVAVNLSPLYFWGLNAETLDEEPELYQFDSVKGDQFSFKAVHFRAPYLIAQNSELAEVWTTLKQMRDQDLKRTEIESLVLSLTN